MTAKKIVNSTKHAVKKVQSNYHEKTPKIARKIGDGMLLLSSVVTLFIPGAKWAIAVGLIGKYVSDCWTE